MINREFFNSLCFVGAKTFVYDRPDDVVVLHFVILTIYFDNSDILDISRVSVLVELRVKIELLR